MALTNSQRAQVRRYLGFSLTAQGSVSLFESALDGLDTADDGGATEALVVGMLEDLADIETDINTFRHLAMAAEAGDGVSVDYARAVAVSKIDGWRLARQIGDVIGVEPIRNVFAG